MLLSLVDICQAVGKIFELVTLLNSTNYEGTVLFGEIRENLVKTKKFFSADIMVYSKKEETMTGQKGFLC